MNKILNWTFGACFRTLGRFLAIFIVGVLLIFIGSKIGIEMPYWLSFKVNASTITSYDTYKNFQDGLSSCGTSGKFSYTTTLPNINGGNFWQSGSLNTSIPGKAHDIALSFNTTLLANTYYDVTINFMLNDLTYNARRDNLSLYSGTSCQDLGSNNLALVSFTNTATSSRNTNKLKLRIYSASVNNYWTILLTANDNKFLTSINNFGIKNIDIVQIEDNSTEDIINNQTNNTENIINNSNANTEKLENAIKDQFVNCKTISQTFNASNIILDDKVLVENGSISDSTYYGISDYIKIYNSSTYNLSSNYNGPNNVSFCIYKNDKSLSRCIKFGGLYEWNFTTNENESYLRLSINKDLASYTLSLLSEKCINRFDETNNTIKDSDISGAEDSASGFFNDFNTQTFGLTSIITAPLNAINSLISSTCSPLVLPLPFVNKNLSLPCMSNVYSQYFGGFFTLYQLITTGLISYYIIVRIFNLVKDFKNPEHDEIEVMDL